MSCNKVNNCKKYKMNIGNPNDWENPCNRCHYNISDYDSGYNKAIDDFTEWLVNHKIVDKDSMPEIIMDFNEEQLKAGEGSK